MTNARVWYVNIFVNDLDRAVHFYADTLGLPLKFSDEKFGYASFATPGAGLALARVEPDAADAAKLVGRHTGIGLGVPDIEAAYEELKGKGVRFTMPPTKQPWGGVLALFCDSEGNILYLDQLRDE
jgi:predicted enzyme related to lactoylglutathione lyase